MQNLNTQNSYSITFSYIGFESYIIKGYQFKASENASLLVKLKEQTNTLNQVVVTGYSTQRKKDLTGSVSIINVSEAKTVPVAGVDQALQGKAAGVTVTGDGQPGGGVSVRVRGFSTIGNNDPLYIIDGVPTTSGISMINASDIESMQVLKRCIISLHLWIPGS
ncbi:TonB-dependent receptor plug domain-containing protein [Pedobacter sp. NJ-S-72]